MTDPRNCRHENIYWEDFFKEAKKIEARCLDCGTEKGRLFAGLCQLWYTKKIEEWLRDNKLSKKTIFFNGEEIHTYTEFEDFLKRNSFKKQWDSLKTGNIAPNNFEGITGQGVFFEYAKSIEYLCQEFKKEKEKLPDKKDKPTEREREREPIYSNTFSKIILNLSNSLIIN